MFVVLVAADLYGIKTNIEIGFPDVPALDELAGHCESTFRNEARRLRPKGSGTQPFTIDNIKIFDDSLNRWLDLTSAAQLLEWSQLYLLQPDGNTVAAGDDEQAILEPPVRIRSPIEAGTNKEKYFFLFHDMDFNGNGHLNREELQRIFNVMCLYQYSQEDVDQFFYQFDTNRDNVLSFAEFSKFMQQFEQVGDDMLKKSIEYWESWRRRPDFRDSSQITAQERDAIIEYLERGRDLNEEVARREEEMRRAQDERLLLEREEELLRAKQRFSRKYGRDVANTTAGGASPAPTATAPVGFGSSSGRALGGSKSQTGTPKKTPSRSNVKSPASGVRK